jgi:CheY-like chemotaxis protein
MQQQMAGLRVYIYDDDPDNVYALHHLLREQGAKTLIGSWARGYASEMLAQLPIDVILVDLVQAGHRTGMEIKAEIRSYPEMARIPVIAVSSADTPLAVPRAIQSGFDGYIAKPVDEGKFPDQILRVVHGQRVWAVA